MVDSTKELCPLFDEIVENVKF